MTRRNPQFFYHGGYLKGPPTILPARAGETEFGPGIYATTSWTTARSYAKGGGVVYRFTLPDDVRWLDDHEEALLTRKEVRDAFAAIPRLPRRVYTDLESMFEHARRLRSDGLIPLEWVLNNLINANAIKGKIGPAVAAMLVEFGADALHIRQSLEDWIVIFNPDIIENIERLDPKKVGKDYPFDLPLRGR